MQCRITVDTRYGHGVTQSTQPESQPVCVQMDNHLKISIIDTHNDAMRIWSPQGQGSRGLGAQLVRSTNWNVLSLPETRDSTQRFQVSIQAHLHQISYGN